MLLNYAKDHKNIVNIETIFISNKSLRLAAEGQLQNIRYRIYYRTKLIKTHLNC